MRSGNWVLQDKIGYLLKRPVGRSPTKSTVTYASFHFKSTKSRYIARAGRCDNFGNFSAFYKTLTLGQP
jgi:hypothetical protein